MMSLFEKLYKKMQLKNIPDIFILFFICILLHSYNDKKKQIKLSIEVIRPFYHKNKNIGKSRIELISLLINSFHYIFPKFLLNVLYL